MTVLGDVIFTSTSMGSDRDHRFAAASSVFITGPVLWILTKTPGEPLMVKDLHFCGAHLVFPKKRQTLGHQSLIFSASGAGGTVGDGSPFSPEGAEAS